MKTCRSPLTSRPERTAPHRRFATLLTLVAACVLLAGPGTAQATTVIELSVPEMTDAASMVVIAEVVETTTRWDGNLILTEATLAVSNCVMGDCPETIVVTTFGGEVGDIVQRIDGAASYSAGDEVLAFLSEEVPGQLLTVGLSQGRFDVASVEGTRFAINRRDGLVFAGGAEPLEHGENHAQSNTLPLCFDLDNLVSAVRHGALSTDYPDAVVSGAILDLVAR